VSTSVARIRNVIEIHGKLPVNIDTLSDGEDLFECGLSSHASVNIMLALEDEFDVEFPDELLRKSTFESVESIRDALQSLGAAGASD
jgi:acyl carrier protein